MRVIPRLLWSYGGVLAVGIALMAAALLEWLVVERRLEEVAAAWQNEALRPSESDP